MKKIECEDCKVAMIPEIGGYRYRESSVTTFVLKPVTLHVCPSCNSEVAEIPRMNELHRKMALELLEEGKERALLSTEIDFLNKWWKIEGMLKMAETIVLDPRGPSDHWIRVREDQ